MNFGEAIEKMKAGARVARAGWNGKGMWIALTPGSSFAAAVAKEGHAAFHRAAEMSDPHEVIHLAPHIDMRAADGTMVIGWLASQTDMLAEDWFVVGIEGNFDALAFRKMVRAAWQAAEDPKPDMQRYVAVSSEEYDLFKASLAPRERFVRNLLDRAGVTHLMLDSIPVSPNPTLAVGCADVVQVDG